MRDHALFLDKNENSVYVPEAFFPRLINGCWAMVADTTQGSRNGSGSLCHGEGQECQERLYD